MTIDWITVSAQIINFLVLVWLLKRFLYQPVIRAMDKREQRIAARLGEAQNREQTANETVNDYRLKQAELQRERDSILDAAKEQAGQEHKQLLEEARNQVNETRSNWQRQLDEEKAAFLDKLRLHTAEAVQGIARKALADLAEVQLQQHIVQVLIQQLKKLDPETHKALASGGPIRVTSSLELDSTTRGKLTRALHDHIDTEAEVVYDQSESLLCGIEIRCGEWRLSWNVDDYLDQLEVRVDEAFHPAEIGSKGG